MREKNDDVVKCYRENDRAVKIYLRMGWEGGVLRVCVCVWRVRNLKIGGSERFFGSKFWFSFRKEGLRVKGWSLEGGIFLGFFFFIE
jgi:hypothetical protein